MLSFVHFSNFSLKEVRQITMVDYNTQYKENVVNWRLILAIKIDHFSSNKFVKLRRFYKKFAEKCWLWFDELFWNLESFKIEYNTKSRISKIFSYSICITDSIASLRLSHSYAKKLNLKVNASLLDVKASQKRGLFRHLLWKPIWAFLQECLKLSYL